MELTTHLELHSQATRLEERAPYDSGLRGTDGIVTLYDSPSQANYPQAAAGDLVYTLQLSHVETTWRFTS